jgi:uncharacterized protein DUF5398
MYGLEKKGNAPFEFQIETDIREDPSKAKQLLKKVDEIMHEIKNSLRQGASSEDFDALGVMLHGFASLQKVLKKIITKK